ncbi:MAG: hypothetical protein ACYC6A_19310 [Armatimonadota bacterium]
MRTVHLLALLLVLPLLAWCAPSAPVAQMTRDLRAGLQQRQLNVEFAEMTAFFSDRLDNSAGAKTFSDKTGNCRLSWFDWMMRHPIESVGASNEFTRMLHDNAGKADGVARIVDIAAGKLDAQVLGGMRPIIRENDPTLRELGSLLLHARQQFGASLAPLTPAERDELQAKLFTQSSGPDAHAPFFADKTEGRRVCDLLEKIDRVSLMRAGEALAGLTNPKILTQLSATGKKLTAGKDTVTVESPAGNILFGGPEANEYRLDELTDICALIDAGGDDTYIEGTVSADRPVLVIIDLGGNDTYMGTSPGIQGGAVLGASLLVDVAGDDAYTAGSVAQGAALAGVGMLVDMAGNDTYKADTRVQGSAVCGIGLLLDKAGNDDYRTALLGQGVGGPLGFGLLDDLAGNDHYYAGGKYPDGYDDTPGYNGWSQGAGVGPRGVANGGIGVLLDGGGDDIYEADYFSHGAGYWFALGFARDFGGNDQRVGSTRTAFDGGERAEKRFLRWGIGFGCHYAAGYLIDDAGNDEYLGDHACVGFNWDIGITALIDLAGNDKYATTASGIGVCYNSGLAVLFDAQGNDTYSSGSIGTAGAKSDYHAQDARSHNFAFFLDQLGEDTYPKGLENGTTTERGWAGGMFIDK